MAYSTEFGLNNANDDPNRGMKRILIFLAVITFIILAIFLLLIFILPLIVLQKAPLMQANQIHISSFNTSNGALKANWDTLFTVYNPNKGIVVNLQTVTGTIYFRDRNPLSVTEASGFCLKPNGKNTLRLNFTTSKGDQPAIRTRVVKKIRGDQAKGSVWFSVKMDAKCEYNVGRFFWKAKVSSLCLDLEVQFVPGTGTGQLVRSPRICDVTLV